MQVIPTSRSGNVGGFCERNLAVATTRLKEVEKDKVWESGKYKVRWAARYLSGKGRPSVSKAVLAKGPDLYHIYCDGLYIAQRASLDEVRQAIDDHKKPADEGK